MLTSITRSNLVVQIAAYFQSVVDTFKCHCSRCLNPDIQDNLDANQFAIPMRTHVRNWHRKLSQYQ